jgi:hypothetical protein
MEFSGDRETLQTPPAGNQRHRRKKVFIMDKKENQLPTGTETILIVDDHETI